MRRLILICGTFLTLMAGVWGGVSAALDACCMQEAGVMAVCDEHDCCRADDEDAGALRSESQTTSHDVSREKTDAPRRSFASCAALNFTGAGTVSTEREIVAVASGGSSCGECCAGGSDQSPAAVVLFHASERNKAKRSAGSVSNGNARNLLAHASSRISTLAAKQHAPPSPQERRYVLHSLFLI